MKYLKLISVLGICFAFMLSCQNGEEPNTNNEAIHNYDGFDEYVLEGSITPVSATLFPGGTNRYICISEFRDSLEMAMDEYDRYDYFTGLIESVKEKNTKDFHKFVTFYDLKPSTTYYYFVTEAGFYSSDPRKIGSIRTFKTQDINLSIDMGGPIEWCGVNYLENREDFKASQFLSSSLFNYRKLPDPSQEVIEGNWRYPTKQELHELLETCSITMVDFVKQFVRITSVGGKHLYIPFTYKEKYGFETYQHQNLMLIPVKNDDEGLYVETPKMDLHNKYSNENYRVMYGDELKEFKLKFADSDNVECRDFFHWSYTHVSIDGSSEEKSGDESRGVRFVREK